MGWFAQIVDDGALVLKRPLGASMVRWTTPDPCLVLSDRDWKLYTNFEFCEEKNHIHVKKHIGLQSHAILWWQKNSMKNLHILEDRASGVQIGDIEQVIV